MRQLSWWRALKTERDERPRTELEKTAVGHPKTRAHLASRGGRLRPLFAALMLGLVLMPTPASADARAQAKKYFKQGMNLIGDGRYEEGIDRLLQAYDIKPHPNVLFNIARAYEALGRPTLAIAFYQRYAETSPSDLSAVNAAIAKLEASLPKPQPAAEPPPKPVETTPSGSGVDEATVKRLAALTERMEAALAKIEAAQAATAEKPTPTPSNGPRAEEDEEEGASDVPYEETVVTASRRAQSTLEAPNATTIITAEEIRLSGARSLPELLRRVPGAEVMAMGVSSYNVSFRGFNQRVANKVLVLIDGRTEYQDFLGITLWSSLPVGLEEIERIEVIRGPGSALYGANAMLGVINIITRTPGKGAGAEATGVFGNGNRAGGSFVGSGGERVKYRVSLGYEQSDKYTRDYAADRPDVASNLPGREMLGLASARGNVVSTLTLNKDVSFSLSAGVNRFFTEIYAIGLLRNYFLDALGGYALADVKLGSLKLKLFWNHFAGDTGPQYSAIGQRSLLTDLESNVFDAEALFQQPFRLFGTHRLQAGASTRLKRLNWGYLSGLKQELHAALFLQDEWRIIQPLLLTVSYRLDYRPAVENADPTFAHSPRVSLLWRISEGHAVRGSFSTSFREPTFLESYTDVRIPVPGINGASVLTQGSPALNPERLLSFELGYRGELASVGLNWELALYQNDVSDLVVLSAVNPVPVDQAFDERSQSFLLGRSSFINDPASYTARGVEAGATWAAIDGLDLRVSAAFQQITGSTASVCGPCSQAPTVRLFAGATYRTPVNIDIGLDAAFTSSTTWVEREPDPQDPTRIANLQNPLPAYAVVNARVGYRLLNDRLNLAVVGTQLAQPHAEHPFGNLVNRRIFATVTVRP